MICGGFFPRFGPVLTMLGVEGDIWTADYTDFCDFSVWFGDVVRPGCKPGPHIGRGAL